VHGEVNLNDCIIDLDSKDKFIPFISFLA